MTIQVKIRPGYKQTELGALPQDWDTVPLSSLCKLVNGRGFKPYEWSRDGFPIIRIQNLNGSDDFNHYSGQFDPKILVEKGQLLFAWSGSRGTSFGPHIWRGRTAVLNYHTWKVVVFGQKVDTLFFFHALRQLTKSIEDEAHGASALVHTQKREMENFLIPTPKRLEEQRAIAAALSDADALIASLDALIAKKRDLKQAAMQQLLTGKTSLQGFEIKPGYKETEVGSIPSDWTIRSFAKTLRIANGQVDPRDAPFKNMTLVAPDHIDEGSGRLRNRLSASEQGAISGKYRFYSNDIVYSKIRPYLKKVILADFDGLCSADMYPLSPCDGVISEFCLYVLLGNRFTDFASTVSARSGIPKINREELAQFHFALPPVGEQRSIADVLSDMDAELIGLEARREKVCAVKQGMMQELLTGRIRLI